MIFPTELLQHIQADYVGTKYKDGSYAFQSLEDDTIRTIITSLFAWLERQDKIKDNMVDISLFTK